MLKRRVSEVFSNEADFSVFRPVTVRLLDPPLHEFVPPRRKGQQEMAEAMGVSIKVIQTTC